jgi:hypothetical protein
MSCNARARLQFLLTWLAQDPSTRARPAPRCQPATAARLAQAQALLTCLQPWLEAVLARRAQLAWRLAEAMPPEQVAALVREAVALVPLDEWLVARLGTSQLRFLLEAELLRLVRLLEVPALRLYQVDHEWWEVTRWALATGLVRISQFAGALAQRQPGAAAGEGLQAVLEMAWQRLTATSTQRVAWQGRGL